MENQVSKSFLGRAAATTFPKARPTPIKMDIPIKMESGTVSTP